MILIITFTLIVLILVNFLLLFFSSNKTEKVSKKEQPLIIRNKNITTINYPQAIA